MSVSRTSEHPATEMKRGRGRPRSPNALTPAQRAKRYRDNKRKKQVTTEPRLGHDAAASPPGGDELAAENARLRDTLEAARTRINDLIGALEFFVSARAKNKRISPDQIKGLHALLALGNPLAEGVPANKKRR